MAYVYLNDGGPESEDYDSNYFYFDENNHQTLALIENMLASGAERDEAFRERLYRICQSSLDHKEGKKSEGKLMGWIKGLSKMIGPSLRVSRPTPGFAQH